LSTKKLTFFLLALNVRWLMDLYDYQEKLIKELRESFKLNNSVCLQLPVGGGKTVVSAFIVKRLSEKGSRSIFLCHRRELIKQAVKTFRAVGCDVGIIASGMDENPNALVQVASVQTLVRRLDTITPPSFLISDEAHHVVAGSWLAIHEKFSGARSLGITATPARLDGRGLIDVYKSLVQGPQVKELISRKFLCPFKLFAPPNYIDLSKVKTVMGEFEKRCL